MKTRSLNRAVGFGIVAWLVFFPAASVSGQEKTSAATETASSKEVSQVTPEQLNAMKAEWEEVREQQIQMIREKEEQFEKLKEELFKKLKTTEDVPAAPVKGAVSPASSVDEAVLKAAEKTQVETLLLQQKEQVLSAREQTLAARESALTQKAAAEESEAGPIASRAPEDLSEEKKELELQKKAFAAERQKFFQEMSRQKEKLFALQSSLDAQAKKIQEDRAHSEQKDPAAAR